MKLDRNSKIGACITYIASMLVPIAIILFAFRRYAIFPFGDNSILASDLSGQYSAYLSYFRGVLLGENDFFYTFSKSLGGDFFGFGAYYLFSPFNILLLLGNQASLPILIEAIIILKVSCCGLTMNCYCRSKRKGYGSILFAVVYALMGYNMAYLYHLMWLDGVILFPVVMLGLERFFDTKGKNGRLYVFALGMTLMCNYYIGYMVCLAVLIVTLVKVLSKTKGKEKYILLGKFGYYSILAGCMAAIVLVPTAFSLMGGKAGMDIKLSWEGKWNGIEIVKALLPLPFQKPEGGIWGQAAPLIYCSVPVVLCAVCYLLMRGVKIKDKAEKIAPLVLFLAMAYLEGGDRIWHAWNRPVGFPYRYSFILSFCLISIGYEGFGRLFSRGGKCLQVKLLFGLLVIGEIGFNAIYSIGAAKQSGLQSLSSYQSKMISMEQKLGQIPGEDFARIEKNYNIALNDPMRYGYSGVSHFSSTDKVKTTDFLGRMGYTTFYEGVNWSGYTGRSTLVSDSFLAIKYLLSESAPDCVWEKLGEGIYENPYALSLGNVFDASLETIGMEKNPFSIQNQIYGGEVLKPLQVVKQRREAGEGKLIYEVEVSTQKEAPVYLYLQTQDRRGVAVSVNGGDKTVYKNNYENGVFCIGNYKKTKIVLEIEGDQVETFIGEPLVYQLDYKRFAECTAEIKKNTVELFKKNSSTLFGVAKVKPDSGGVLLFSIPYDAGWRVWLDGEEVKTEEFLEALLGIRIAEGEHSILLRYRPRGWYAGCMLSSVFVIYILWALFCSVFVRRPNERIKIINEKDAK